MVKAAIFPGSFDPFHDGHKFIVEEALKDFDLIYIIISWNENKVRTYDFQTIFEQINQIYFNHPSIKILINENDLTVNWARKLNCFNIIRGYRNQKDLKYEKKLAHAYLLDLPNLNFFYYHHKKYQKISSTKLKSML